MRKTIIIINGRGGVGKDALISGISRIEFPRRIGVMNVSSIDPVKKLAKEAGWNGTKDERSRKFLSDLKKLCTEYNNLPQKHCEAKVFEFLASDKDVMFIHIREPEAIRSMKVAAENIINQCSSDASVITLLITREGVGATGNSSDDRVEEYDYDIIYDNSNSLERSVEEFYKTITAMIYSQTAA